MELESTRVGKGIPGIKLKVSWSIKEFGLERADALMLRKNVDTLLCLG